MYVENQDDFYNMVVSGYVSEEVDSHQLLEKIHFIESSLGRDRSKEIRNGPRSIDIDIEFFGDQKIQTENLVVPHPRIAERAFVLIPMLEILKESADLIKEDVFQNYLKTADRTGIEKILSAEDFKELKVK